MNDTQQTPRPTSDWATEDDVYFAYRLLLCRQPDPNGFEVNRKFVEDGKVSLEMLLHRFVNSVEFDRILSRILNSKEYRLRHEAGSLPTPIDMGGYQVVVQKGESDFGRSISNHHAHEEHVCQVFREFLRKDDVVVDVGANVGVMTFLAASIVGEAGRVIAVEPNPNNLQLLYRGILANNLSNVSILPHAASNVSTVFSLSADTSNTSVIGARAPDGFGPFVQSVVLDDQLAGLTRINFVKMDIEGHEPRALEGFSRLMARHRPVFVVEFNPRCLKVAQQVPLAFLHQIFAWYRQVRVTSGLRDNVTFESADKVMEYWEKRNREVTEEELLPDGMLHFDLIAIP